MGTTLSTLCPPIGAKKRPKRVGRGDGSGTGTTAARGQKGQKSRRGANFRPWFEGGQMPLIRRMPKRGFKNPFRKEYFPVNLAQLVQSFESGSVVTVRTLKEKGLVPRKAQLVKVLGQGECTIPLTISVHAFSANAAERIRAAGGTADVININAERSAAA